MSEHIQYIVIKQPEFTGRIRARKVYSNAEKLKEKAEKTREPAVRITHGGSVANAYGWKAETECLLELALPPINIDGSQKTYIVQFYSQIPANKVTLAGAAEACWGKKFARIIWDGRYNKKNKENARKRLIEETYAIIAKEILL